MRKIQVLYINGSWMRKLLKGDSGTKTIFYKLIKNKFNPEIKGRFLSIRTETSYNQAIMRDTLRGETLTNLKIKLDQSDE